MDGILKGLRVVEGGRCGCGCNTRVFDGTKSCYLVVADETKIY